MSVQPRRVRLKPWLLAQVSGGTYPGLQWIGPDRRLFQIPWRHATRHMPASDEENTIFRAWALETGKYQEGLDEPDPAKWKANLRCALNKSREFRLTFDGTKETPVQPYKIYEVCEQLCNGDTPDDGSELPNIVDLSLATDPQLDDPPEFSSERSDVPYQSPMVNRFGPAHMLPVSHANPPATATHSEFHGHMDAEPGRFVHPGHLPVVPAPVMETPMSGVQTQGESQPCIYDLLSSPHMLPLTDLDIRFQYRGRTAGSLTVSNPQGCRLYYGNLEPTPDQVDLFGPVTLNQVLFPGTVEIQNQKQKFYTDQLLDVMDRGLILEIRGQDIYAVRLCQCKVYWSGPGVPEQGPPNHMEREKKIKVFSLNDFLHGLILHQKSQAPVLPAFEIYFCFGEDWPDKKPKEKKLIMVQVVPVVARILTEMFSGEMSWSLDSIRLQISNPDLKDKTVEQFKELHRLLQSQHAHGPWTPNVP
ncbi:interferon regulatory factor 5 isoform X2 [Denticeps clupeoides]|nr:interferon regulatory factor 5 isoform X2 [Denticeps clupeoides]XP_028809647.1 interferon regulatory factor 5 isoform X2 [Denticeps clupeoides]XP_028809648.1 interferon regulatory factor 5 isoform X2 [Denticeps clupeoides]XP_028809649.1 interferon regulatory factor 5 isoform X2 [Denticeps clupeoides]XP_028809650.1 interferon regulatory factor 5 isoform X2 [Denticeps clupeoides]